MTRRPACLVLLCVLGLAAACDKNKRADTLRVSLAAVNGLREGLVEFDRAHQMNILDEATSREQVRAELAAYRARRDIIEAGFQLVYRLIAAAAVADDDLSFKEAVEHAASLAVTVKDFMDAIKKKPPKPPEVTPPVRQPPTVTPDPAPSTRGP